MGHRADSHPIYHWMRRLTPHLPLDEVQIPLEVGSHPIQWWMMYESIWYSTHNKFMYDNSNENDLPPVFTVLLMFPNSSIKCFCTFSAQTQSLSICFSLWNCICCGHFDLVLGYGRKYPSKPGCPRNAEWHAYPPLHSDTYNNVMTHLRLE